MGPLITSISTLNLVVLWSRKKWQTYTWMWPRPALCPRGLCHAGTLIMCDRPACLQSHQPDAQKQKRREREREIKSSSLTFHSYLDLTRRPSWNGFKCHRKCTNKDHVLDVVGKVVSHNRFIYIIKTYFPLNIHKKLVTMVANGWCERRMVIKPPVLVVM